MVHDSIRQRQLEAGVPRRVAAALRLFTWTNDDILWAALFVLAVMLRDTSTIHKVGCRQAGSLQGMVCTTAVCTRAVCTAAASDYEPAAYRAHPA